MKIIGLTGGIGSGKSTVSTYLKKQGIDVVDADAISRSIVQPKSTLLSCLVEEFGQSILHQDGSLNRKGLGALVFSDQSKKRRLDELMHREIIRKIQFQLKQLEKENRGIAIIDAPLLLETDLKDMVDVVWLVDTTEELQVQRVIHRDGMPKQQILQRMQHQMPSAQKRNFADAIIDNSKDLAYLYNQIDTLLSDITEEEHDKTR